MSTDDYDDSEGPNDDHEWQCICVLLSVFVIAVIATIAVVILLGAI